MTITIPLPSAAHLVRINGDTATFRDGVTGQTFTVRSSRLTEEQVRIAMLEARADYYERSGEPKFPLGSVSCAVAIVSFLAFCGLIVAVLYFVR